MIITGSIPKDSADIALSYIDNDMFPWYWNDSQLKDEENGGLNYKTYGMLCHSLYKNNQQQSAWFEFMCPPVQWVINKHNLDIKNLFRMQLNLNLNINVSESEIENSIHMDTDKKTDLSLVYYMMDSDGDTVIYDNDGNEIKRIEPKKGTYVLFPSTYKHRQSVPVKNKRRIVINAVFEMNEEIS